MPPYTLEYQDHGFESWEHNIISYETVNDGIYDKNVDTKIMS